MENSNRKYNLTTKQREAYEWIKAYIENEGGSPSYDEIMLGIGLKSKSGVSSLCNGLKDRGWIDFKPNLARSIIIL
jgi:SOS-response transcriptional repressor LexA